MPVPHSAARVVGHHQRLAHEQSELVEDLVSLDLGAAGDGTGGGEVESTHERRKPAKQDSLGLGQQRMRPIHRRMQCLLATHRSAGTTGQQAEAVVQTVDDLVERQRTHPGRGEFDGQRHAVEATADLLHSVVVVVGDL